MFYLLVDGKCLGLLDAQQREELALEHLRGIEFVPVCAPVVANVRDLRPRRAYGAVIRREVA